MARSGAAGSPFGRRHQVHDGLQHLVNARAALGADQQGVLGVEAHQVLDLFPDALRFGRGQVDLVDDRDDLQIVLERQVGVGQSLRLDALGGVHHQQRALAGLQAAGDLVGEVHVARACRSGSTGTRCRRRPCS